MSRLVAFILSLVSAASFAAPPPTVPFSQYYRKSETATQGTLSLYVDPAGSNGNDCLAANRACATVQGAFDKIPHIVRHSVTVNLSAGTHAGGAILANKVIEYSAAAAVPSPGITIKGELIAATKDGLMSGTVTSATASTLATNTWATLTVTGAGWTTNQLRGMLLRVTTGATVQIAAVSDNTATVITTGTDWTVTPTGSSTFEILDWATTISGGASSPVTTISTSVSATNHYSLMFIGNKAATGTGGFLVEQLKFGALTVASGASIELRDSRTVHVRYARFEPGGSTRNAIRSLFSSSVSVQASSAFVAAGSGLRAFYSGENGGELQRMSVSTSVVENMVGVIAASVVGSINSLRVVGVPTSQPAISIGYAADLSIFKTRLDCNSTGSAILTSGNATSVSQRPNVSVKYWGFHADNCPTVFDYAGGKHYFNVSGSVASVTGTGNTTVFSLYDGAYVLINSSVSITGTTEVSVDGTTMTLAALRALTNKAFTGPSLSFIREP